MTKINFLAKQKLLTDKYFFSNLLCVCWLVHKEATVVEAVLTISPLGSWWMVVSVSVSVSDILNNDSNFFLSDFEKWRRIVQNFAESNRKILVPLSSYYCFVFASIDIFGPNLGKLNIKKCLSHFETFKNEGNLLLCQMPLKIRKRDPNVIK